MKNVIALIVVLVCCFQTLTLAFTTDVRLLLATSNQNNSECVPNENQTGITCSGVVLYDTNVHGTEILVTMNLNTTFKDSQFWTEVWIWTNVSNSEQLLSHFTFNSTTPNGTWLSTGSTQLETLKLPTDNNQVPWIYVTAAVTHNTSLITYNCSENNPQNHSYCSSGATQTVVGLSASGNLTQGQTEIKFTLDDLQAVVVNRPFQYEVDQTTFCVNSSKEVTVDPNMTVSLDICNGSSCSSATVSLNTTGLDESSVVIDECFANSLG